MLLPRPPSPYRLLQSSYPRIRPFRRTPSSARCPNWQKQWLADVQRRTYSSQKHTQRPGSFWEQLRESLKNTKTEWYAIPAGLGIAVVGFTQIRKNASRNQKESGEELYGGGWHDPNEKSVRPMRSWQVHVLSTLPLKALSYYWGKFNEIPLPTPLRIPGFKLYAWIFGVNLSEVGEDDLRSYKNLAEFFYRQLKPGCRPIDPRPEVLVSPADGKVLQFGEVRTGGQVEQVKGMTYSLDSLLGAQTSGITPNPASAVKAKLEGRSIDTGTTAARFGAGGDGDKDHTVVQQEEEFAKVNGISYTLPALLSGDSATPASAEEDVSVPGASDDQVEVGAELSRGAISSWWGGDVAAQRKRLFFAVVYLAPGDYHRFHSPVSWVVERRRHFAGELYSVSPFLQSRLPNLFTLNERVALLGRWRHGMFSMTPVGATNVGSIKIHFDRELRTNSLTKETRAEQQKDGFAEATYRGASALLGGHPIVKGAEMGGFNLGSTIVLVFEAPGSSKETGEGGFRFVVKKGQKVKVGEALGYVEE